MQDKEGPAALLQAAIEGRTEIVKFLVSKGVDVNEKVPEGTGLLQAAMA